VGWNSEGTISACYVTGRVIVDLREGYAAGGLVGESWRGTITACYATGRVDGCVEIGGLVGFNEDSMITACYATGAVNGECWSVGGLVGENYFGTITTCYATGTVNASEYVGGLVGSNGNGTIKDCFWDMETSGQTTSAGGEGKTTAEMKTLVTFTDAGWDFVGESANGTTDVWRMCVDGISYPRLSWEFSRGGDMDCPNGVELEDLAYLAGRWMASTPETTGAADTNGDGKVDLSDFGVMAENWTKGL